MDEDGFPALVEPPEDAALVDDPADVLRHLTGEHGGDPAGVGFLLTPGVGEDPGRSVLDRDRCVEQRADGVRQHEEIAGQAVVRVAEERSDVAVQPPGSDFGEDLARPGDVLVVKRTVGAFHGTGLDRRLRDLGVDTLVFGGLVTTMGVESTARAASDHGYEVEFVADAMSAFEAGEHDVTVGRIFPRFGAVRDTGDYV